LLGPDEAETLLDPASPAVAALAAQIDALTGIDPACGEPLEGLRIGPAGREARFDFFDPDDFDGPLARGGQRTWTATVFLDRPEAGGQMLFPNAGLRLTPAPGHLLLWCNLAPDGGPNGFSVHETLPVEAGSHCLVVRRYRERPYPG
jgi:prolyl 4-hydroxylase